MQEETDLKLQAYKDLTLRARGGIVIYLAVWLITALWVGMHEYEPLFFYVNTLLFAATTVARTVHYRLFLRDPNTNLERNYALLVGMILFSGFHWGAMSSWVIFLDPNTVLHYPYMVLLAAFAMGGTCVLSISHAISMLYPLFIYVPTVVVGLIFGGGEEYMLGLLAVFSTVYALEAARVSRNDYWTAVSSHKEAEQYALEMETLSVTDPLTGLNNRMYFNKHFAEEWARSSRQKSSLSLLMVDLDHFKSINDGFGHATGDIYLKEVASALRSEIKRMTDTIARYGGEEFVVLLPDTDSETALKIAHTLLQSIAEMTPSSKQGPSSISCSIGLATLVPTPEISSDELIKAADKALYKAKEDGRNRCCTFDGDWHCLSSS